MASHSLFCIFLFLIVLVLTVLPYHQKAWSLCDKFQPDSLCHYLTDQLTAGATQRHCQRARKRTLKNSVALTTPTTPVVSMPPRLSRVPSMSDFVYLAYLFPNDVPERDRLKLQSECVKHLLGNKLYLAPLSRSKPPVRVMDVATGLGDWAIELGDLFPESIIVGTDLSPIQPDEVPPNVHFYVEDA